MGNILKEHSKEAIIRAISDNGSGFIDGFDPDCGFGELLRFDDASGLITGVDLFLFNAYLKIRFSEENARDRVRNLMEVFKEKNLPMMWMIDPLSSPGNLLDVLKEEGMQVPEKGSPGMGCDLRNVTEEMLFESTEKSDVIIKKVENKDDLDIYMNTFVDGYDIPEKFSNDFRKFFTCIEANMVNYIAFKADKPVAISSVFYYAGVAGIWNVATLPDYRGKGIGTAITLAPMIDAKKKGYEISTLESSPLGINVYQRIGFEEYCKTYRCIYQPTE